jgi:histidinol-phosphate aminotransferase
LRLGMAFASAEIVLTLNNIKAPYNINLATQQLALNALEQAASVRQWTETLCKERARVAPLLGTFSFVVKVYPSDANFILLQVTDANELYRFLLEHQVVVRNRSNQPGCEACLRITIGTAEENDLLLKIFNDYARIISGQK